MACFFLHEHFVILKKVFIFTYTKRANDMKNIEQITKELIELHNDSGIFGTPDSLDLFSKIDIDIMDESSESFVYEDDLDVKQFAGDNYVTILNFHGWVTGEDVSVDQIDVDLFDENGEQIQFVVKNKKDGIEIKRIIRHCELQN